MKFSYYGHSCFGISVSGKNLLFDPFIRPNELAGGKVDLDAIQADYILVSHGHSDHIADCVELAQQTGALVISNFEVCEWLGKQGLTRLHPMNTGGRREFEGFSVKCTVAQHSSGLPDGTYGGNPMGFIIYTEEGNFFYSGDTALTLDMQLIPRWAKLNFAILPIGDNFTMGAADALLCAEMIGTKDIIGVHYDTFGYIRIDHEAAKNVFAQANGKLRLPEIGSSIDL